MIANRAVDIVQPDLHYGGGLICATKVARLAAAVGTGGASHVGGRLGYLTWCSLPRSRRTSATIWSSRGTPICR